MYLYQVKCVKYMTPERNYLIFCGQNWLHSHEQRVYDTVGLVQIAALANRAILPFLTMYVTFVKIGI